VKIGLHLQNFSDIVLGLGPWSLVVLKDKVSVLGPGLGLEHRVLVNITAEFMTENRTTFLANCTV